MALSVENKVERLAHGVGKPTLLTRFLRIASVARQRRHLSALSDHMLRDIGVTRAEAEAESRKAAWDVPDHWQR